MKTDPNSRYPLAVRRDLVGVGENLKTARRKRRMAIADVTAAAGISADTLRRLEKGDPGVSLGAFSMVLLALGERHRLKGFLDIATDDTGLLIDASKLPKRVRRRKGEIEGL